MGDGGQADGAGSASEARGRAKRGPRRRGPGGTVTGVGMLSSRRPLPSSTKTKIEKSIHSTAGPERNARLISWAGSASLIGVVADVGGVGKSEPSTSSTSKRMKEQTSPMQMTYVASQRVAMSLTGRRCLFTARASHRLPGEVNTLNIWPRDCPSSERLG